MAHQDQKSILVTGATGQQGGAVLRHLRERGFPLRAVTRDPDQPKARALAESGADVVQADLTNPQSLRGALRGMYGAYSVQGLTFEVEAEITEGINLADAANGENIRHFVYSSVSASDQNTGIPHFESKFRIEQHIRNTGMPYTILRPVFFMETLLRMREQVAQGSISMPLSPQTRFQMVAVDDIGEFAAIAFDRPEHWQNRIVDLASDERSMVEIAEILSSVTGHEVKYVQTPWDEYEKRGGSERAMMYRWFDTVGYHVDIAALRRENPKLHTFEQWARENWNAH